MAKNPLYIVFALTRAVKVCHIYGIEHPAFNTAFVPLYEELTDYLNDSDTVSFDIEEWSMLHGDDVVYHDEDKETSIAFKLFRDGVRRITFSQGLTSDELLLFLKIVGLATREEDIALNLLESDLSNMDFYIVEEEDEPLSYKIPEARKEDVDYESKINAIIARENLDPHVALTPDLTPDELTSLEQELSTDGIELVLPQAITILVETLKTEKSREVIDGLAELLRTCIEKKDLHNVRRIVQTLQGYPELNWVEKIENETTIRSCRDFVNTPDDEVFKAFLELVAFLTKKSIPYLLRLMADVRRPDRLVALRRRIAYIAHGDPAPIATSLKTDDPATLINAIAILGLMQIKRAVPYLQSLTDHRVPAIRVEVVTALKHIGEPAGIATFLDDPNRDVRVKALQALSDVRYPAIYRRLLEQLQEDSFLKLDIGEQREYLKCLVANGGDGLTQNLRAMLFKRSLFGSRKYRIIRKLAAAGLAHMKSQEALAILRQGARHKNRDIRSACEMALERT